MQVDGIIALHNVVKLRSPLPVNSGKIDRGLLEGILAKTDEGISGHKRYSTNFQKSACILEGIARLHPFTDGNKRTALISAVAFLLNEGIELRLAKNDILYVQYVASCEYVKQDDIDMLIDEIAMWMLHRVKKMK